MDEAVIRKVKEIVIRRKIAENEGEASRMDQMEQRVGELQDKVESKIASLEAKIDLMLQKMQ